MEENENENEVEVENLNPFLDFYMALKLRKIDITKPHWISKKVEYQLVTNFWQGLGALPNGYKLKKICRRKGCLNPAHFRLVMENFDTDYSEIEELTEFIDLKEAQALGLKTYTEKFNYNNPLPVTEKEMAAALNLILVREKKEGFFHV